MKPSPVVTVVTVVTATTAALALFLAAVRDQPAQISETEAEVVTPRTGEAEVSLAPEPGPDGDADADAEWDEPVVYRTPLEAAERIREYVPRAETPADFPRDVPTYEGRPGSDAQVVAAFSQPGQGQMVTLRSGDPPEQIFAYYKDELAEDGWAVESELERPRHLMLTTSKGDRQVRLSVIASEEGDFSQVMVRVTRSR